jgi:hypothetical protein
MKRILMTSAVLAAVIAASAASAEVVATQSFQSPAQPASSIRYGPDEDAYNTNVVGPVVMSGVAFNGFSGISTNTASGFSTGGYWNNTPDGDQFAFLQTYQGGGASLDWSVSGLTVGKLYTLSFLDAAGISPGGEPFSISAPGGATVDFSPSSSTWQTQTYSFRPTSTSETIAFADTLLSSNQITGLDAFSLSTVPEPATWAMMLAGFFGLGASLRRRREESQILA